MFFVRTTLARNLWECHFSCAPPLCTKSVCMSSFVCMCTTPVHEICLHVVFRAHNRPCTKSAGMAFFVRTAPVHEICLNDVFRAHYPCTKSVGMIFFVRTAPVHEICGNDVFRHMHHPCARTLSACRLSCTQPPCTKSAGMAFFVRTAHVNQIDDNQQPPSIRKPLTH